MKDTTVGKRYYVSKQFYRFLRPGARMVATTSDDSQVLAASFEHSTIGNFVTILVNGSTSSKSVTVQGSNVPTTMDAYRTSASENFVKLATVKNGAVTLPPRSITTLINGGFKDTDRPASTAAQVAVATTGQALGDLTGSPVVDSNHGESAAASDSGSNPVQVDGIEDSEGGCSIQGTHAPRAAGQILALLGLSFLAVKRRRRSARS
jgi:hypothetical protein